jgi:hypothetical protein
MPSTARWALAMAVTLGALTTSVHGQSMDVVEGANGDRLSGDVRGLERGALTFRTGRASRPGASRWAATIVIVWTEVVRLTSLQNLDVELASGERLTGTISSPAAGQLVVQTASGPSRPIDMKDVISIIRIEAGFRARTTGSIDFGLNFTTAQRARTYTLNSEAEHRSVTLAYETQLAFDSWLSAQRDTERLTRNDLVVDVRRRLPDRWFAVTTLEAQQNEEMELDVRLVAGGGIGRKLVQSNRTHFLVQGGLNYDAERYSSAGVFDHSAEIFGGADWDWFDVGSSTEARVEATTYIGLARKRVRLDWDATVRRDVFWDLYWAVNAYDRADSDPPADQPGSNFGVSVTLGWTF